MKYELYKGASVVVDYQRTGIDDLVDSFEEESNFEGFAILDRIDLEAGEFFIEEFSRPISLDYLIVFNHDAKEYEYYDATRI